MHSLEDYVGMIATENFCSLCYCKSQICTLFIYNICWAFNVFIDSTAEGVDRKRTTRSKNAHKVELNLRQHDATGESQIYTVYAFHM